MDMLRQLRRLGHLNSDEWLEISSRISENPRQADPFLDILTPAPSTHAGGKIELLALNPDHPGFADVEYRKRRNAIAKQALEYVSGDSIPHADYSQPEHAVWSMVNAELEPIHQALVCREILILKAQFDLDINKVPQLSMVNEKLQKI